MFISEVGFWAYLVFILRLSPNSCYAYSIVVAPQCLPSWDKQMQTLCTQVNLVIEKIQFLEPEWSRVALASQINWSLKCQSILSPSHENIQENPSIELLYKTQSLKRFTIKSRRLCGSNNINFRQIYLFISLFWIHLLIQTIISIKNFAKQIKLRIAFQSWHIYLKKGLVAERSLVDLPFVSTT